MLIIKKTTDLLLTSLPSITGYASVLENVGSVENKGIEISLNSDIIRSKDLVWHANIVLQRMKISMSLGNVLKILLPTAPTGQQSPVIVQVGLRSVLWVILQTDYSLK